MPVDQNMASPHPQKTDDYLDSSVDSLLHVATKRLELLHRLEIYRVYDLISFFPREYENWSNVLSIDSLIDGVEAVFIGMVRQKPGLRRKGKMSILQTVLTDQSGSIRAIWFNQPYLSSKLEKGQFYIFRGKIRRDGRVFEVINPKFHEDESNNSLMIQPVYPLTKGLKQGVIRSLIVQALPKAISLLPEPIPMDVRKEENLCTAAYAYEKIHFPSTEEELEQARKRLVYEELFLVIGGLKWMKMQNSEHSNAQRIVLDTARKKLVEVFVSRLPFRLTKDQHSVCMDILGDLSKNHPMNRLVQGDVGSGKTIVAIIAMYACALCGFQSVYMAPTSILASQHYHTLSELFSGMGVRVDLLLGSSKESEKRQIRENIASGETQIVVGTHAVLSEKNVFCSLALMITDEQHRFGVRQRGAMMLNNDIALHTLVMSATPIPRTLALILYGDLDISVIQMIPSGRMPIETYMSSSGENERIFGIMKRQIEAGRQIYYVCPLIESDEDDTDRMSVTALYEKFSKETFEQYSVCLLHGDLKSAEKENVMRRFSNGEIDILISTTVVEVGVDNPNASMMIVENAERFGLSTLHQLRGRIGRGPHRAVCILKTDSEDLLATKRLQTMCATSDGFLLAEKDLELRGPGDFFGTRQHGIPALRIANLYRDAKLLNKISKKVETIFAKKDAFSANERDSLLDAFERRFGKEMRRPPL